MQFGVGSARRGWLTRDDVLNTRPLDELAPAGRASPAVIPLGPLLQAQVQSPATRVDSR